MKLKTLKPKIRQANLSIAKSPSQTLRMRGGNLVRRNRMMKMRNPLCAVCDAMGFVTEADEFDHIVPLADGGADEEENIQGLCWRHHRIKSRLEQERRTTY